MKEADTAEKSAKSHAGFCKEAAGLASSEFEHFKKTIDEKKTYRDEEEDLRTD